MIKQLSPEAQDLISTNGVWVKKRSHHILQIGQKGAKKIKQELKLFFGAFGGFTYQNKEYVFPYDPKNLISYGMKYGYITLMQDNYCHITADIAQAMAKFLYDKQKSVLVPFAGYGILSNAALKYCDNVYTQNIDFGDIAQYTIPTYNHSSLETVDSKFDYVIMKPPMLAGKDIKAIITAFKLVKPGGQLVSLLSWSSFYGFKGKNKSFDSVMSNIKSYTEIPHDLFTLAAPHQDAVLVVLQRE